MKKLYLTGLFLILLLGACSNPYTTIEEQDKKMKELNKIIEELEVKRDENFTKQGSRELLKQCFNDAEKKSAESVLYWLDYQDTTCNKYDDIDAQLYCVDSVLESIEKIKKEKLIIRAECLKIYPQ